jgi:hypothetical protein
MVTITAVIKIPTNMSILFMRELSLRPKDKYGPRPKGIRAQTRGRGDFEIWKRSSEKGGFEGFKVKGGMGQGGEKGVEKMGKGV